MPTDVAGAFKWKDEVYIKDYCADTLLVKDWQQKETARLRPLLPYEPSPSPFDYGPRPGGITSPSSTTSPAATATWIPEEDPPQTNCLAEAAKRLGTPPKWPPGPAPPTPAERMALIRGRTLPKKTWEWCRPLPGAKTDPSTSEKHQIEHGAHADPRLSRVLSSPSTLTAEGVKEAARVLGSMVNAGMGTSICQLASSTTNSLEILPPEKNAGGVVSSKVPKTCNQIYGARAHESDRKRVFLPKSTCDVCLFSDVAHKTKTPYCPSIRF